MKNFLTALTGLAGAALLAAGCASSPVPAPVGGFAAPAPEPLPVIPEPRRVQAAEGELLLAREVHLQTATPAAATPAGVFTAWLEEEGFAVTSGPAAGRPGTTTIRFDALPAPDPGEGYYQLSVSPNGAVVIASGEAGFLHGAATFTQLLRHALDEDGRPAIPSMELEDGPEFAWRGLMLDSARHFQSKEYILGLLDTMAYYKLNVFHWHFVDNNGWRVEIDRYPLLTEAAAWRPVAGATEGEMYGGYHTKEDVREILRHAAERNIRVIPEIEMPAHITAALHAYPEYTCSGERFPVGNGGLAHYTARAGSVPYCAGRDETFTFIGNILDEIIELFPDPVLHVGGDERPAGVWEACPRCQARMEAEGLPDEHALQTWFMNRITDYLATKDRRAISWAVTRSNPYDPEDMDDIGNNAIIQNWHDGAAFAARQGWQVVNSNNTFVYLDYPEYPGMDKPQWMPIIDLARLYSFNPVPDSLTPEQAANIIGVEACLWTEMVPDERSTDEALFPRVLALSEVAWRAHEERSFPAFEARALRHRPVMEARGTAFSRPPEPSATEE